VNLGIKEVSEEQIFEILRERIAHYLGEELAAAGVEPGLEPDVRDPRGEPHEALAFSVLSFAKGKLGGFKEAYPLLQDEEARVQLATLVVTAVDKAVEEVLQFAKELIDFLDGGNLESIEKFRETLFGALGDYVGSGCRSERAK
jgi:hypothetical protein